MSWSLWLWVGVAGLFTLASTSKGLMCYHCSNCRHERGTPLMCNYGYDVCTKVVIVGRVEKSCGKQQICGFGPHSRGSISSWNHLQKLLSDVNTDLLRIPAGMDASSVDCCYTDYCNSAKEIMPSFLSLMLPLLLYIMYFKII
ncbi:uncharacterized protein [Palaemon carinicauda]|uniref:uncharacterized protein isoform X1 n=1 Tax=Palaemon carinicauda TaxID=392227 RepID=UPI0035B590B5